MGFVQGSLRGASGSHTCQTNGIFDGLSHQQQKIRGNLVAGTGCLLVAY